MRDTDGAHYVHMQVSLTPPNHSRELAEAGGRGCVLVAVGKVSFWRRISKCWQKMRLVDSIFVRK